MCVNATTWHIDSEFQTLHKLINFRLKTVTGLN